MYLNLFNIIEGDYPKKYKGLIENDINLMLTFMHNVNLVMSSYKVKDLPITCNERFLKICHIFRGSMCMYNSEEYGLINPMGSPGGKVNFYLEPVNVTLAVTGSDINELKLSGKIVDIYIEGADNTNAKAVWERANYMGVPPIFEIMRYSEMMADTMASIRTAARTLKIPWILTCPPELKEQLENIIDDIDKNALAVISLDLSKANRVELFDTRNNPEVLKSLWEHYRNLQNELMTKLGIQNQNNTDKRERLLVDEVNANNEEIDLNEESFMYGPTRFCKKCNDFFKTNMSVERTTKGERANVMQKETETEGPTE